MNGKFIAGALVIPAVVAGAAIYYLQVYAYYEPVEATAPDAQITLVSVATGQPDPIPVTEYQGIDATSSPIRYRACFHTAQSLAMLTETYEIAPEAKPLTGPGWFSCYNAGAIGAALEEGSAVAFIGQKNIHDGVDRIIAVYPDGRAFAWQQINEKYKD